MGILERMSTLIKSNLNAAIDSMSDPGKEIEQLILDMEQQARRAREEVAAALGAEKRGQRRAEELEAEVAKWQERAEQAVRAGDDALARQALERKAEVAASAAQSRRTLDEQASYADQLTAALKQLDARIEEVKAKKGTLKAKARAQKGRGPLGSSAFDEFDRLAGKVDAVEAEAALDEELAAQRHEDAQSRAAERKLDELSKDHDIDDKLAALKAKLEKKDGEP
jgi:phage shock protein A